MNPAFPRLLFVSVIGLFPLMATAQSQKTDIRPNANRLMADEIKYEFSGITHNGAYNFTDEGDPRRFYKETTRLDGRTHYSENGSVASGDWFIKNDSLCFDYDNDALSSGCFRVYRVGNCFYYYDASFIQLKNELDQYYWTARSVKDGESPNCNPGLS